MDDEQPKELAEETVEEKSKVSSQSAQDRVDEATPKESGEHRPYNVQESTPLEDFICLLVEPFRFFKSFRSGELTFWVFVKAVLGLLSAVWLASINTPSLEESFRQAAEKGFFDEWIEQLSKELPMAQTVFADFSDGRVFHYLGMMDQLVLILAPVSKFFQIFLLVFATFIGVKLFVRNKSVPFKKLFAVAVYSHWMILWGALPFGGLLALIHPMYLYILAVSEQGEVSRVKSFFISYLVKFILMIALSFLLSLLFAFLIAFFVASHSA